MLQERVWPLLTWGKMMANATQNNAPDNTRTPGDAHQGARKQLACLHELNEDGNAGPGRPRQPTGLRYVRAGMVVSQQHHNLYTTATVPHHKVYDTKHMAA